MRVKIDDRRPSRTSMELTWAQLQHLADDFDLGRVIQMDTPTTTQCNTTDPFRTGQGTFLLRARHAEEYAERVEYLHHILDFLFGRGFPVPEVMRSRSGRSWTIWGERIVEIHRFVPHDPGTHRDWSRMFAAASALGDLHAMLCSVPDDKMPVPPEMRNDVTPSQCLTLLEEAENLLGTQESEPTKVEAARAIIQDTRDLLDGMLKDYSRIIGSLPWMTIHGDYHFWNLLYRADQIVAVVDYDFLQERERLFDIAYALQSAIGYLRRFYPVSLTDYQAISWENIRLWLDHYDAASHLPLSKTERLLLPAELLRIHLVSIATSLYQPRPVDRVLHAGGNLPLFEWIAQQKNLFTHAGE